MVAFSSLASIGVFLSLSSSSIVSAEKKNVYHIQAQRSYINEMEKLYPVEMDIWNRELIPTEESITDPLLDLTVYTTSSFVDTFLKQIHGTSKSMRGFPSAQSTLFSVREEPIDMDDLVAEEKKNNAFCQEKAAAKQIVIDENGDSTLRESTFFDCFNTWEDMYSFLDQMVEQNSQYISKHPISTTFEGKTIYRYTISTGENKPAVFIQGLLHAREWLSPPTVMFTMASLLDGISAQDSSVTSMLDQYDFHFVPIVNLDGYDYSWNKSRLWRKNRRPNGYFSTGVDLNRNYGPAESFCKSGASSNGASDTYCGTAPFSEPEIAGIEEFITANEDSIAAGLDIHTYGSMVLRPFGYSRQLCPDEANLKVLGDKVRDSINSDSNGKYISIRSAELYPAAGAFDDAFYFLHGKKPSFTIELRGRNFVVNPSEIRKSGSEILKGLQTLVLNLN